MATPTPPPTSSSGASWRRFGEVVREALLDAWALVQPIECLGCGAVDRALCRQCRAELVPGNAVRVRCDADPGVPVFCAAAYAGPVRGAISALKDTARPDAARPLSRLLRVALEAALVSARRPEPDPAQLAAPVPIELAWVPSRLAALRRRGLDPVKEIIMAARLPRSRVLVARRGAATQKTLGREARLAADGRFRVRTRLDGRRFILVDDVVTTGATLADAVASIRAAGGSVVAAAAVCAPDLLRRGIPA